MSCDADVAGGQGEEENEHEGVLSVRSINDVGGEGF